MVNFNLEREAYNNNVKMIGVDVGGSGSIKRQIVASACWINFKDYKLLHPDVNDSKKVISKKRKEIILSLNNSVKYCSAIATEKEIDLYGLTWANMMAMKRSIYSLIKYLNYSSTNRKEKFFLYIDGKYKPKFFENKKELKLEIDSLMPLIKGDSKSKTIALASIIAKETRDCIMKNYSYIYPNYNFDKNKGYGTSQHKDAILKHGIIRLHRKSFKPISTIYSQIF